MSERNPSGQVLTSLARRFTVIVAILATLIVALVTILVLQGRSATTALAAGQRDSAVVAIANRQETRLLDLAAAQRGFIITGDVGFLAPLPEIQQALRADFARLRMLEPPNSNPDANDDIDRIAALFDRFTSEWLPRVIDARERNAGEAIRLVGTGEGERRADAIRAEIGAFVAAESDKETRSVAQAGRRLRQATVITSSALVLILLGCTFAALYLRRRVIRPIVSVARTADAIAAGEKGARVGVTGTNEVGRLCAAFDGMADSVSAIQTALEARNTDLEREKGVAQRARSVTEAVLAATPAAICLFHSNGRLIMGNRSLKDIPAAALVDLDYKTPISDDFEDAANGRHFRRHFAPISLPDGSELGSLLVIDDITRERTAERLKSDLVATVSHELRAPLAAILGYSEVLARRDPDRKTRREYAETINREAERLTRLVSDLLDLQRIEQGRLQMSEEEVDLAEILREQASTFAGQSEHHQIKLEGVNGPVNINADRDRIGQVVANLVSNAIKYSTSGGTVTIALRSNGDRATVSVTDEGIGLSAKDLEQVFERFFRADIPEVAAIRGTGLGLSLADEIVRAHGGTFSARSTLGEGSTFRFELPLATPTAAPAQGLGSRFPTLASDTDRP